MMADQASVMLFDLALILIVTRALGALANRIGQPAVIGEVLGGVLLGPTLFSGLVSRTLFPMDVRPFLTALANLGVALFMFVVGLELDQKLVKGRLRTAFAVSIGSIALPLGMGMLLALYLVHSYPTAHRLGFCLFMGAAMSATAFPVLARILRDRGLDQTRLGGLTLASASISDVLAWSLLAVVVAVVGGAMHWQLLLALPYLVLMFTVIRRSLARLAVKHQESGTLSKTSFALVLMGLLVSCGFTEWIGLHFIFGAFLFGVIIPRNASLRTDILGPIEKLSVTLLLPVYFVVSGLQVDLSGLGATSGLATLGLVLVVAVGAKFLGTFTGAKLAGQPNGTATALGILMNTRGLTELIILTVGLQLGVLDTDLYSLMVVMALITTAMTGPLLRLVTPSTVSAVTALAMDSPGC